MYFILQYIVWNGFRNIWCIWLFFYMTSPCSHVVVPAEISHHIGIETALVPPFYGWHILVESLSLFVTYFAKIRGKEIQVGMQKVHF